MSSEPVDSGSGGGSTSTGSTDGSSGGSTGGLRSRVLAIVASWLVGGILAFRDQVTAFFLGAQQAFIGALESGSEPIAESVAVVAQLPLDLVGLLTTELSAVAAMAGPFAPLVVVVAWAIAAMLALATVRFIWWLLPLVIPWL